MTIAFVLINTELGEGAEVASYLQEMDEVTEVYAVYGVYDYIIKLEADSMSGLKDIITNKIRRINNIRSSLTLITVD